MAKNRRRAQKNRIEYRRSQLGRVKRINVLPDDVLLEIFDFCLNEYPILPMKWRARAWSSLVHVCRQWRSLVFRSPHRLNLQLYCTPQTPAKNTLDVWPAFPLIIHGSMAITSSTDDIVAALGKSNRVCDVELQLAGWQLDEVLAAMQVPFPELTDLRLSSHNEMPSATHDKTPAPPAIPLPGPFPRLRNFSLHGSLFPALPKLFLSATHLVFLNLSDIPHSGYISPEEMVAPLSVVSSLEALSLGFRSPQSRPDLENRNLPRPKSSLLPALRRLHFKGVTEYFEELVTLIDTPQIDGMNIVFFNQIDFICTRLAQFINRSPKLRERDEAHVQFDDSTVGISLRNRTYNLSLPSHELLINISCREPDWQLSSVEQVCNSFYPLSAPRDLCIEDEYSQLVWESGAIENNLWLELLLPFTAVENLYLSKEFAPGVAVALQDLVGITGVLPRLQNIFVEELEPSGPLQENFGRFVAARQPIAISVRSWKKPPKHSQRKRIDVLPEDVLLNIFDFYMKMHSSYRSKPGTEAWQSLVHVCQWWRSLIFGSPRRLNLQLYCTPETPAKDTLDIWPAIPLIVEGNMASSSGTNNVVAALKQSNRIRQVELHLTSRQLEDVMASMQVPFPELTVMELSSDDETLPVIPDSFLGGSAPYLQSFSLSGIPFPGLPKLLFPATHLVDLYLSNIPHSGYISPEAMVALLSALSSLETVTLEFQSPQSRGESLRPWRPKIHSILPALYEFRFKGVAEYLEDLVTLIDTPQLEEMDITFFNRINFDCPGLNQFISRRRRLRVSNEAHVQFNDSTVSVTFRYQTPESSTDNLFINILCGEPDWQLSSIEQVCNSVTDFIFCSTVEDLYIEHEYSQLVWTNDAIENTIWLELFHPFTPVKNLYLSKEFAPSIAATLQELVVEVLPSLRNIFVEGLEVSVPLQETFGKFAAARQLSGHPVSISVWRG